MISTWEMGNRGNENTWLERWVRKAPLLLFCLVLALKLSFVLILTHTGPNNTNEKDEKNIGSINSCLSVRSRKMECVCNIRGISVLSAWICLGEGDGQQ